MSNTLSQFNTPFFTHDCDSCEFLFSIRDGNGECADVYKQCDANSHSPFLIRFGNEGHEYATTTLTSLVWSYMQVHDPMWRKP